MSSPFIFSSLPALPSPPASPDEERDELTKYVLEGTMPPVSAPALPPIPALGLLSDAGGHFGNVPTILPPSSASAPSAGGYFRDVSVLGASPLGVPPALDDKKMEL